MKIDSYAFGRIVINGQSYTDDVIIYPDRVETSWLREEGHRLQFIDLTRVLQAKPEVLIIGTGKAGVMHVPKELVDRISLQRIEVMVERTAKAVELYNALAGTRDVIAAFHITC